MSFLAYCLLLTLYMHASNARHIGITNLSFGKVLVRHQVEREKHQTTSSSSSATKVFSHEKELLQGNAMISSPRVILQEAAITEEWRRHARSILQDLKPHDAEEPVDSKENGGVVEDVVVMDYAQPHRTTPTHNKDP